MYQFDFTKYLTHASVSFLTVSAYDSLIEGRDFKQFSLYDGGAFATSSVLSLLGSDLLESVWAGMSQHSLQGMITKPLLNGLIYMYMYDAFVLPNNKYITNRSGTENFIMGALGDVIIKYIENPIVGLFFGHKVY
jgi:hypothetical protein